MLSPCLIVADCLITLGSHLSGYGINALMTKRDAVRAINHIG